MPALVAFLTVALGTVSLVLLWEWLQEQQRKRHMVDQLRSLANDPAGLAGGSSRFPFGGAAVSLAPSNRRSGSAASGCRHSCSSRRADLDAADPDPFVAGHGARAREHDPDRDRLGPGRNCCDDLRCNAAESSTSGAGAAKRLNAFEELLPESIDLVGRALRAGHPLTAGFKMAADDGSEPVAGEFRRIFEEQRFGLPLQDSLLGMADRVNLVDVRILVTAILIQREVGGNLAEILDNLAAVVRARFTIRRQLRVYTAQGRMTGYLLSALPIILFSILYMLNPSYMSILFTDPIGKILVGVANLDAAGRIPLDPQDHQYRDLRLSCWP